MSPHSVTVRENVTYIASCNRCGWNVVYTDRSAAEHSATFHSCRETRQR
jgi:hypothetical protein